MVGAQHKSYTIVNTGGKFSSRTILHINVPNAYKLTIHKYTPAKIFMKIS